MRTLILLQKRKVMKNNSVLIFLILLVATAFYFLGRKNGKSDATVSVLQNVQMIKQIAELSALEIAGTENIKISNKGTEDDTWAKFKNYFAENTLQVNVPYTAKYGLDIANEKMDVDTKQTTLKIYLPHCKLLSMQLRFDAMETMTQTGIFTSASMVDLVNAQKQLYTQALQQLGSSDKYVKLAEQHVGDVFTNYYTPLGYKVECIFRDTTKKN